MKSARLIALLVPPLLAACGGAHALPTRRSAPAGALGQSIEVVGPEDGFFHAGSSAAIHEGLINDLREAGLRVEPHSENAQLALSFSTMGSTLSARLRIGGRDVDEFEVSQAGLPCSGAMFDRSTTLNCMRRTLVNELLGSERVEKAWPALARAPAPPPGAPHRLRLTGKLAVLELRNLTSELTRENAQYLTDVIRQAALQADTGATVMTRENLLVLLQSSGRRLEDCEGECEVDTGRRIGADAIISGEVQKLGSKFKLSLRLHDTRAGTLLASVTGSGASIDELDESVGRAAAALFEAR